MSAVECARCGAAALSTYALERCMRCGERWQPSRGMPAIDAVPDSAWLVCDHCLKRTPAGWPRCGRCGIEHNYAPGMAAGVHVLSDRQLQINRRGIARVRAALAEAKARGTYDPNHGTAIEQYLDGYNPDGSRKDEGGSDEA